MFGKPEIDLTVLCGSIVFAKDYWISTVELLDILRIANNPPSVRSYLGYAKYIVTNQGDLKTIEVWNQDGQTGLISVVIFPMPVWADWAHQMIFIHLPKRSS